MQRISPFLWFDGQAEAAALFYTSVFRNSSIGEISRYGDAGPGPKGSVMVVSFALDGFKFLALNGGPEFKFTPAVSFVVSCETQEEIDRLWDALSEGGSHMQCGWLTDKFGVTWQIVPSVLGSLMAGPDPKRSAKVAAALMQMVKLDIAALQAAYDSV